MAISGKSLPCDSGNRFCDSSQGTPAVVSAVTGFFYHYDLDRDEPDPLSGFRLIPALLSAVRDYPHNPPQERKIIDDKDQCTRNVRCYVGIKPSLNGKSRAIFTHLLDNTEERKMTTL